MTTLQQLNNALAGLNAELDAIANKVFPVVPLPDDHDCKLGSDGWCPCTEPTDKCFECGADIMDNGIPSRCKDC